MGATNDVKNNTQSLIAPLQISLEKMKPIKRKVDRIDKRLDDIENKLRKIDGLENKLDKILNLMEVNN